MKVIQQKQHFMPVTITIESQEELNWLYACLNTSALTPTTLWDNFMGSDFDNLSESVQIPMFNAISKLFDNRGETK